MDYDHTPPEFTTDRHRDKANMPIKNVRPMTGGRDAAGSRASSFGKNPTPTPQFANGTKGAAVLGGRHGSTSKSAHNPGTMNLGKY